MPIDRDEIRLRRFRVAERLMLWLALAGMVLSVHLWIQKARDFDQGCLGLAKHAVAQEAGCREVGELPGSHLLGISNAAWGYAFYFALALLAFAKLVAPSRWAGRFHATIVGLVAAGAAYSAYLVFEMVAVAHALCPLCLGSAILVAVLAMLCGYIYRLGGPKPVAAAERGAELGLAAGAAFGALGLMAAVLIFVDRLGTRALDEGTPGRELRDLIGETLPAFIDMKQLAQMSACHLDWEAPTLAGSGIVTPDTPFVGPEGGVQVVAFYDPNCPHCKAHSAGFFALADRYRDRARFTVLPRLLWDQSIPQVEALKLAERSGKYLELWKRMLADQPGPGKSMTTARIASLFRELGLDDSDLPARLAAARPAVLKLRELERRLDIFEAPVVFVGGRRIFWYNQSIPCVETLIERVRAAEDQGGRP